MSGQQQTTNISQLVQGILTTPNLPWLTASRPKQTFSFGQISPAVSALCLSTAQAESALAATLAMLGYDMEKDMAKQMAESSQQSAIATQTAMQKQAEATRDDAYGALISAGAQGAIYATAMGSTAIRNNFGKSQEIKTKVENAKTSEDKMKEWQANPAKCTAKPAVRTVADLDSGKQLDSTRKFLSKPLTDKPIDTDAESEMGTAFATAGGRTKDADGNKTEWGLIKDHIEEVNKNVKQEQQNNQQSIDAFDSKLFNSANMFGQFGTGTLMMFKQDAQNAQAQQEADKVYFQSASDLWRSGGWDMESKSIDSMQSLQQMVHQTRTGFSDANRV